MDAERRFTLAVFASDRGPGDAERASIMSQAGRFFASRGARLVCPVLGGALSIPLIKSARSAGGDVTIVSDLQFAVPSALAGIASERFAAKTELHQRVGTLADAYVGLPGSLASVTALFETWVSTGGGKPVALLNRNRAYEVFRGFTADVISHSASDWERHLQFADTVEDLWNRLTRMLA
jgi:hypothetical protein